MWHVAFLLSVLVAAFSSGPAAAQTPRSTNILALGEDAGPRTVERGTPVYGRVVAALNEAMITSGFRVFDETAVTQRFDVQPRQRRNDQAVIELARAIVDPPIDAVLIFGIDAHAVVNQGQNQLEPRVVIVARVLDLASGRVFTTLEAGADVPMRPLPLTCRGVCFVNAAGDMARPIATSLGIELSRRLEVIATRTSASPRPSGESNVVAVPVPPNTRAPAQSGTPQIEAVVAPPGVASVQPSPVPAPVAIVPVTAPAPEPQMSVTPPQITSPAIAATPGSERPAVAATPVPQTPPAEAMIVAVPVPVPAPTSGVVSPMIGAIPMEPRVTPVPAPVHTPTSTACGPRQVTMIILEGFAATEIDDVDRFLGALRCYDRHRRMDEGVARIAFWYETGADLLALERDLVDGLDLLGVSGRVTRDNRRFNVTRTRP
jgi:hypothetical protein